MILFRFLFIASYLLLSYPALTQNHSSVRAKLVKRYGQAIPWGNGYIVKAKVFSGFANTSGDIIIPVSNYRFDTLLSDIAAVYGYNGTFLVNNRGSRISEATGIFRVVNRKKRLLANTSYENVERLCTDHGTFIVTEELYTSTPKNALLTLSRYTEKETLFGIITAGGDTLIPPEYQTASHGKNIYACMRHDTAFVFHRNGKLLFTKTGVHGCAVLASDFVVLQKYGMEALANARGRLLTGFHHHNIEVLNYADTTVMLDKRHSKVASVPTPGFFLVGNGVYGLVDSTGKEIFPTIYDGISMSSKGWFIVRKEGYNKEQLLDPKLKEVLQTEIYGLQFINARYARAEFNRYDENKQTRIYDMALNRFTTKTFPEKDENRYSNDAPWVDYYKDRYSTHNFPDSIILNEVGTVLLKKKGRWGVRALSGDTILPFVYDSVAQFGYNYIGLNKKFAILNWEGGLATGFDLPGVPRSFVGDSLFAVGDNQVFSYKGQRLRAIDPAKASQEDPYLRVVNGILWSDGKHGLRRGIYNRNRKRLADLPYPLPDYYPNVSSTGILGIQDSATKRVSVMDTLGRQLTPWIKAPKSLLVAGKYALALNDTGKADFLFRYQDTHTYFDTVWVDPLRKKNILYPVWNQYQHRDQWPWNPPLLFEKKGDGFGALNLDKALIIPGSEKLQVNSKIIAASIKNKWTAYDWDNNQLLPAEYDSIHMQDHGYYKLFKNTKVGIFDVRLKKLYEGDYDSVLYPGSLANHFFIGYKKGYAQFVDAKGYTISQGWKFPGNNGYQCLGGIPAKRNGNSYLLYPTLGDSLQAELVKEETPQADEEEDLSFTHVRLTINGRKGIYDKIDKHWIVPANYAEVESGAGYFFARVYEPALTTVFSEKGVKLFSIDGIYYSPRLIHQSQLQMGGTYDGPIVNCRGMVIVPDTFEYINTFQKPGKPLYYARTRKDKYMVIDTTGRVMIPAILDHVDERPVHREYHRVWIENKMGLMNTSGKLIAHGIYEEISDGRPKTREKRYGWYAPPQNKIIQVDDPYFVVTKGSREKFKWGIIDGKGRATVPCMYDSILYIVESKIVVAKKGNYWGLITIYNKPVTDFIYDSFDEYGDLEFRRKGLHGSLSNEGKEQLLDW